MYTCNHHNYCPDDDGIYDFCGFSFLCFLFSVFIHILEMEAFIQLMKKCHKKVEKKLDGLNLSNVHQTNWFEHCHTKKTIQLLQFKNLSQ